MFEKPNPIAKKYASIDLAGREAIREQSIQVFPGFNEDLRKNFTGVMEFTPESQQVVQRRILSRIQEIGEECGIDFLLAGRDFPLHSTILEGRSVESLDEEARNEFFKKMDTAENFRQAVAQLEEMVLEYKYLLIDRGNVLLAAVAIPNEVVKTRDELSTVYTDNGLAPRPLDNILHISLARITKLPQDGNIAEVLKKYVQEMIKLRHSISAEPLKLKVSAVLGESSYDMLIRS